MAIVQVPVTKGKGVVEIDTDAIPQEVYAEALLQGLKVLVNRGASKVTKEAYPDDDELKAAAMAKANEQVELINTGKIKFTGQKSSSKVTGAVKTEAMRLAKALVKDAMKRDGIKVSHVKASEITAAAKEILEAMPDLIAQAEANLKARDAIALPEGIKVSVKTDPEKVAKAEAKKKGTLSATQAGKVKTRQRPQANA